MWASFKALCQNAVKKECQSVEFWLPACEGGWLVYESSPVPLLQGGSVLVCFLTLCRQAVLRTVSMRGSHSGNETRRPSWLLRCFPLSISYTAQLVNLDVLFLKKINFFIEFWSFFGRI